MDSFNLDIGSYSVAELRKVFQLPPSYTAKEVDAREVSLAKQLESTRAMSASRKKDVLMFLKNAGDVLRKYASGKDGKDPNEGTWAESYAPTTEVDSHVIIQDLILTVMVVWITGETPYGMGPLLSMYKIPSGA